MSIIGNGNTHKVLIGCLSRPIDSNAPGIQLAMWLGQMKIFRTMLCTMCQNYYYIQYATMWLPLHTELSGGLSSLKVLLLLFHNLLYYYLLLSLLPWQWFSFTITLYHKILELFYLWCQINLKLQENCAINAQAANHLKTAVIVTFLTRSLALHQTAEPQEALWHLLKVENLH